MMNWNAIDGWARIAPVLAARLDERAKPLSTHERGRCAILVGWIVTMLGIVGYVAAMGRAPQNADTIDALATQGLLGWGSLLVILAGVVLWVIGSIAMLHDIAEMPPANTHPEDL
jgi:hypothetical protein